MSVSFGRKKKINIQQWKIICVLFFNLPFHSNPESSFAFGRKWQMRWNKCIFHLFMENIRHDKMSVHIFKDIYSSYQMRYSWIQIWHLVKCLFIRNQEHQFPNWHVEIRIFTFLLTQNLSKNGNLHLDPRQLVESFISSVEFIGTK